VSVQVAQLADVVDRTEGEAALRDRPDDDWLVLWADSRGFAHRDVARRVLEAGDVAFASIGGVAVGRGVAVGDWLGITAMVTAPGARRRGHAWAILHTLARWGSTRGCTRSMLQVDSTNEVALALYARAGFTPHHEYRYWILW
jgi:GNAT superfamily N-acetyltransferase